MTIPHLPIQQDDLPPVSQFYSDLICSICWLPLQLESSKTDELGVAVHEECYLIKLRSEQTPVDISG